MKIKIKSVILTVCLFVIVILSCLVVISKAVVKPEDVSLVKDITQEENRIIANKYSGEFDPSVSDLNISAEKPPELLTPEEVLKEDVVELPIGSKPPVSDRRNTSTVLQKPTTPLIFGEIDEVLKTIREDNEVSGESMESILAKESTLKKEKNDKMYLERASRNVGREEVVRGVMFRSRQGETVTFDSLSAEKGVVVVPFTVSNKQEYQCLLDVLPLYEKYSDKISFLFLNCGFDNAEPVQTVNSTLSLTQSDEDGSLPIYFDDAWTFVLSMGFTEKHEFLVCNKDSYIIERISCADISRLTEVLEGLVV